VANYLPEKQKAIANGKLAHPWRETANNTKKRRELGFLATAQA
jgi:hypothetical protein